MFNDQFDGTAQDSGSGESGSDAKRKQPAVINSEELLGGSKELWIRHHDEVYRLRLTRNGRLILTK
ncbi:MAG TPA: hemin uptake protein HemP [Planctomycetaceae bacterium]|nr:hemin uptake protein HemP [Planctomycetaceae bacterium]|tara:strand:- start:657 stop:854 length:198 start_codon:yes stop_codon:yes gene_type:complete